MQTHLTLSLTWSACWADIRLGVTANAPVIVILTSISLWDLTQVLLSAVTTLNVSEQLTAILRAKWWDWSLLFQWYLDCNPPPCWIIWFRGGLKVALLWYLLSAGDNGITVDIVVSGGYEYHPSRSVAVHRAECFTGCWLHVPQLTELCLVMFHWSSCKHLAQITCLIFK